MCRHHSTHRRGAVPSVSVTSAGVPRVVRPVRRCTRPSLVSQARPTGRRCRLRCRAVRPVLRRPVRRQGRNAAPRPGRICSPSCSLSDVPRYPARWCAPGRAPGNSQGAPALPDPSGRGCAVLDSPSWPTKVGQPSGHQHRLSMQGDGGHAVEARDVVLGQRDDSRGCLSVQQHERPRDAQRRRQLCIGQAPAKQGPSLVGGQNVLG